MEKQAEKLPIGYWLKKADTLLTERINEIHLVTGLSRTDWQLLHTINNSRQISVNELINILAPFARKQELNQLIGNLLSRNLIQYEDSSEQVISLTATGQQLHQQCLERTTRADQLN